MRDYLQEVFHGVDFSSSAYKLKRKYGGSEMAADKTAETQDIAQRYFNAWTSRDRKTVTSLLAEEFHFAGMGASVTGREAFLNAASFPPDAETRMVAEAYQGELGFQLYESARAGRSVLIAECLTVRNRQIVSSTLVTDGAAFMAFAQG
jgi:hypothetical protein